MKRLLITIVTISLLAGCNSQSIRDMTPPEHTAKSVHQNVQSDKTQELLGNDPTISQKQDVLARIDKMTNELVGNKKRYETIAEKVEKIRQAIQRQDYALADRLIRNNYKTYTSLIDSIKKNIDEEYENSLGKWINQDKNNPIPLILRAQYYKSIGWAVRGEKFISYIPVNKIELFRTFMEMSKKDITSAIALDKHSPISWNLLMEILYGRGNSPEMEATFQKAIKAVPDSYSIYLYRLLTLQPKWGGSVEEMYHFVNYYANQSGEASPMKMLYLHLYSMFVTMASDRCYRESGDKMESCVAQIMNLIVTDDLARNLGDTLNLAKDADEWGFSLGLGQVFQTLINKQNIKRYTWMMLELASENLRPVSEDVEKNFMIEKVTGSLFAAQNDSQQALWAFSRAIDALNKIKAPDEESRNYQLAMIYDEMAKVLYYAQERERAVAHHRAAEYLAGEIRNNDSRHFHCEIVFRLNLFKEAIRVCSSEIENNGNLSAALWRGNAYQELGERDKAIKDMTLLADSEAKNRSYAALFLVTQSGQDDDGNKMMKTLNRYPYLFDENLTSKAHLSTAYADRCYANELLKKYKEALDDCTTSLKYKPSMYAYNIQRHLVKILNKSRPGDKDRKRIEE